MAMLLSFSTLIETVDGVVDWIESALSDWNGIFGDVDFTVLYSWLPADIRAAITAILVVLIVLGVMGLVKKFSFFFS